MGRTNNGVSSKVTHNIKREVAGHSGKAQESGEANYKAGTMADMASHNGPKGSSGKEMGMGGVGDNKGTDGSDKIGFRSHKG